MQHRRHTVPEHRWCDCCRKPQLECTCDAAKLNEFARRHRTLERITRQFDWQNRKALSAPEPQDGRRQLKVVRVHLDHRAPVSVGHYVINEHGNRYRITKVRTQGTRQFLHVLTSPKIPKHAIVHRIRWHRSE